MHDNKPTLVGRLTTRKLHRSSGSDHCARTIDPIVVWGRTTGQSRDSRTRLFRGWFSHSRRWGGATTPRGKVTHWLHDHWPLIIGLVGVLTSTGTSWRYGWPI